MPDIYQHLVRCEGAANKIITIEKHMYDSGDESPYLVVPTIKKTLRGIAEDSPVIAGMFYACIIKAEG